MTAATDSSTDTVYVIFQWFAFVVSTLTAIFVYSLDNTIVANIIPVRISHQPNLSFVHR